jgi:hypothetical protein
MDKTPIQNLRAIDINSEAAQVMWILAKLEAKLLFKAGTKIFMFFSSQILTLFLEMFDGFLQQLQHAVFRFLVWVY